MKKIKDVMFSGPANTWYVYEHVLYMHVYVSLAPSPCWPRTPSLTTRPPRLHYWRWGPVGNVGCLSPCSTLRGPWSASSLSSAAASPALTAEETQGTGKLGAGKDFLSYSWIQVPLPCTIMSQVFYRHMSLMINRKRLDSAITLPISLPLERKRS